MPIARPFGRLPFRLVALAVAVGPAAAAADPAVAPAATTRPAARTISVPEEPPTPVGATPQQAEWLKAFDTGQRRFEATFRDAPPPDPDPAAAGEPPVPWRLVWVSYPSPVRTPWPEANVVPGELYLPRPAAGAAARSPAARVPAAVVLDILAGSSVIPRALARGLAEQGVAALYVPMACYGPRRPPGGVHLRYYADRPELTPDNLRQTVMDVRRAKAVLAAVPEVDPGRIGITGVSLGGIMTALAAGVDGTFYRVVPILAGGDVATLCFTAGPVRRIRQACEAKGIGRDRLAALLAPVEPLNYADRIDPARCLMINAAADEVISPASTAALRAAIGAGPAAGPPAAGPPRMLTVPVGHYAAMLYLPTVRRRVAEYLLGVPADRLDLAAP